MADEAGDSETPVQLSFKVKTSNNELYDITIAETATVLDLKTKLSGNEYSKLNHTNFKIIYSGRVLKDADQLKTYKIKDGNQLHMIKSAASNLAQLPPATAQGSSAGVPRAAAGVPTNMAAGTSAGNLLAGLTGARFAGHMGLPGADMFGADGGMGAPPNEDQVASMLDDPNTQQLLNEALNNPQMVDMMISQIPQLRNDPNARAMFASPEFRRMLTDPGTMRQAAQMRRMMEGGGGGAGGGFPAPGVTDTTPGGAPGTANTGTQAGPGNPFGNLFGGLGMPSAPGAGAPGSGGAANPFSFFAPPAAGQTPSQTPPAPGSAGQATPGAEGAAVNPFASLLQGGAGAGGANPFAAGFQPTQEQIEQAMRMFGPGGPFGGAGAGAAPQPAAPADTRPPEERYANELRQLNDMGFFDFDRNIEALRRSGGSVQGAINSLLE